MLYTNWQNVFGKSVLLACLLMVNILGCSDGIKTDKNIIGLEEQEVLKKFSTPTVNKTVILTANSSLSEYQSNLYKFFPNLKATDTVRIRELLWERKQNTEAVWLESKNNKWVVIDHLKWSNDIKF